MAEEFVISKEELECIICMDDLVHSQTLPCGHSFCKNCQENLLEFDGDGSATLKCPKCARSAEIQKDQTIDDVLYKNFMLESVLDKLNQSRNDQTNCQGEHGYNITSTRYCRCCRKRLCKTCFDEHPCERNDPINISFHYQANCFRPICEEHKSFETFICKQCNDTLICIYCKNRAHKRHIITDLDSHIQELKRKIADELEAAKRCSGNIKQSKVQLTQEFQEFREELSKELLVRKYININNYIAQQNEEESNMLKDFDDHVKEFFTQRKQMVSSFDEVEKLLEDREEVSTLLMIAEQNILLEKLQAISKQLSLKIILHDRTTDNHLGELEVHVQDDQGERRTTDASSDEKNIAAILCVIYNDSMTEMILQTDLRNIQKITDETFIALTKRYQHFTFEDISKIRNEKEVAELKLALTFGTKGRKECELLNVAVENNQLKFLQMILECTNVDTSGRYNNMPALLIAANSGYHECVKLLLEHGSNVDINNKFGSTALMLASKNGHIECVKVLLENDCNVDFKNNRGWTALMLASKSGHKECVKLLVENNCNVDMYQDDGWTALMFASNNGHKECVKVLLENNCNVDIKNYNGRTALKLASNNLHIECVNTLKQYKF